MIQSHTKRVFRPLIALLCTGAFAVCAQVPAVVFEDSLEEGVVGLAPNAPIVGSYVYNGTNETHKFVVLSGPTEGGPSGAIKGENYACFQNSPIVSMLYAIPLVAQDTPFHVSFYKWRAGTAGALQMVVGNGTKVNATTQLLYTTDWPETLSWRWFAGVSHQDSGLFFATNQWQFVEIDWDGTVATGRIDGGPATPLGSWGTLDKLVDRLLFRAAYPETKVYIDDIKVTTSAPLLVRSFRPGANATGQPRLPVIDLKIINGAYELQTGTIQFFVNGEPVTPTVTQNVWQGLTVSTIAYQPTVPFGYGSSNWVRVVYSDNAPVTNQYSREWGFTVEAVNFDAAVALFQDGFEGTPVGQQPVTPVVGDHWAVPVAGEYSTFTVVSGPVDGGPGGAAEGNNYVQSDIQSQAPGLGHAAQAWLSTHFIAQDAPFHISFYKWRPALSCSPQMIVGNSLRVSALDQLLYTTDWEGIYAWRWYGGSSHQDTGLNFTPGKWEFIEISWDGAKATGRIDGGQIVPLGIFGSADKVINQLLFREGTKKPSRFYLDDIKVRTAAPLLVRAIEPTPNTVSQSRRQIIRLELADGAANLQTNTIQLTLNNQPVSPAVDQTQTNGVTVTAVSYQPDVSLDYNSSNTLRFVCFDNATPPNQFIREWSFNVVEADGVFADSFEASKSVFVPSALGAAFEGTNCLAIKRIDTQRPELIATTDPVAASAAGDVIQMSFGFRIAGNGGPIGLSFRDGTTQVAGFNLYNDGRVSVFNAAWETQYFETQSLLLDAWNTVQIVYTNSSGVWSVSVNGAPFETKTSDGVNRNINGFRLYTSGKDAAAWIDSLELKNLTANTVLFQDGLETAVAGVPPVADTPAIGTYTGITPGALDGGLFVSEGVGAFYYFPNTPQIGGYDVDYTTANVVTGGAHGGTRSIDLYQGAAGMEFHPAVPSGVRVHAEAWIKWQAGNVSWGLLGDRTNQFARLTLNDSYGITLFDGTNEVEVGGHTVGVWEKCALDYVVGTGTITVSINDYPSTIPVEPSSTLTGLFFIAPNDGMSRASVDDVLVQAELGNIPPTDPVLNITLSDEESILSWDNGAGYVLQQNSDLGNSNAWTNVPAGGISPVSLPRAEEPRYYRLVKPF